MPVLVCGHQATFGGIPDSVLMPNTWPDKQKFEFMPCALQPIICLSANVVKDQGQVKPLFTGITLYTHHHIGYSIIDLPPMT